MKAKLINEQGGKTYAVVFDKGEEVMAGLQDFAGTNNLGGSGGICRSGNSRFLLRTAGARGTINTQITLILFAKRLSDVHSGGQRCPTGRPRPAPAASPNAGKLAGVRGVWAAYCQLVGDGGRRVLFAGLSEGGGSFALAGLGARAPGEERLAPDLVEDVVQ